MNPAAPHNSDTQEIDKLRDKITQANLPPEFLEKLNRILERLEKRLLSSGYSDDFDKELKYVEFVCSLPFNRSSQDILDIKRATEILNKNHYGMALVKERILEYLSILILNSRQGKAYHSQVLSLVGLVGSGKTSLAYSIAEALGRKIIRIPFGGLGSVRELRGISRSQVGAEPGSLMKFIHDSGYNNPVVLLDEIDRVAQESRSDVMGVLVELLDPEQNNAFVDHFVDFPFDLSKVLFITTANNTGNIATAVLDRLEVIEMPSYSDEEKIAIGRNYLLPKALQEAGLESGVITLDDALWPQIVRPLGFDGGIRSLQRNVQTVVRKIARQVVEGKPGPYHLSADTIGQYLS